MVGTIGRERSAHAEPAGGRARAPGLRGRSPSLDAVRVALAFAVLAYHLSGTIALPRYFDVAAYASIFSIGDARIPFFFVLSGFLLTLLHADDVGRPRSALDFLRRRFVRIYPLYWVVLVVVVAAAFVLPGYADRVPEPAVLAKAFLLLPQQSESAGPTGAPLIVVAWTLHYEVVFYLVFALWIAHPVSGAAVACVLLMNWMTCSDGDCGAYRDFLARPYALDFAIGAVAAWFARRAPPGPLWRPAACAVLVFYGALAVLEYVVPSRGGAVEWGPLFGVVAGIALPCLLLAEASRDSVRRSGWVRELSSASYALYLVHFPAISAGCKLAIAAGLRGPVGAAVAFVAIAAGCVALALAMHRWVERPLTNALTRLPGVAPPPTTG